MVTSKTDTVSLCIKQNLIHNLDIQHAPWRIILHALQTHETHEHLPAFHLFVLNNICVIYIKISNSYIYVQLHIATN